MTHKLLCLIQLILVLSPTVCMLKDSHQTDNNVQVTKKQEASDYNFEVLHFNDAYDIFKSAYFLAQWEANLTPKTLKFFSGDLYSPSDYSSDFQGKQFLPFLEYAQIHAAVVGNHEFDYGEKIFEELKMAKHSDFWLNTNVLHTPEGIERTGKPFGHVKQYNVFRAGQNDEILVGVIALADESWLSSSHLKKGTFELVDPVESAKGWARKLKDKGVAIVIALTHMSNTSDKKLIEEVADIDFVLGGHEHMYYYAQRNGKFVLKSGVDFEHFSRLKITKSASPVENTFRDGHEFVLTDENAHEIPTTIKVSVPHDGQYLNVMIERIAVPMKEESPKHQEMETQLAEWRHQFAYLQEPAFQLDGDLDAREETVRTGETTLCQLVTDLLRLDAKTDIAMLNSGGFRLNKIMKSGETITWGDMRKLLPFKDEIVSLHLEADEIVKFLEQGLEGYLGEKRKPIMNVSGLTFQFDESKPNNQRVVRESIKINGKMMDNNDRYSIAITKFHGDGGDGFVVFSKAKDAPKLIQDMTPMGIMKKAWQTPMKDKKKVAQFKQFKSRYPDITIDGLYNYPILDTIDKNDRRIVGYSPGILPSKVANIMPSANALAKYLPSNLGGMNQVQTDKQDTLIRELVKPAVAKAKDTKQGTAVRTNNMMRNFDMDSKPDFGMQRGESTDYMSKAGETNRFAPKINNDNAFHTLFKDTNQVKGHEVFMINPTPQKSRMSNIHGTPLGELRPKEAPLVTIKTQARRMV